MASFEHHKEPPRYPALAKAVVVDSRFSSRSDLVNGLKSAALFDQIVEAGSIGDGLTAIRTQPTDACVVGPSVTTAKACDFFRKCTECSYSKDCAFIAVVDQANAAAADELRASGAQAIVVRPFTKQALFDGVVSAVIGANAASPWRAIKDGEVPAEPARQPEPQSEPAKPTGMSAELVAALSNAVSSAASLLRSIANGVQCGVYLHDAAGNPTRKSQQALQSVVRQIVREIGEAEGQTADFGAFLEQAFTRWFCDLRDHNSKEANNRLRMALVSYQPKSAADCVKH
jgi:hypothetical protein